MSFELSFFLGFLFTAGLFLFCFLTVAGAKTLIGIINRFFPKKAKQIEVQTTPPKKPKSPPQAVKSIEIDPSLVDKIYVKKSS